MKNELDWEVNTDSKWLIIVIPGAVFVLFIILEIVLSMQGKRSPIGGNRPDMAIGNIEQEVAISDNELDLVLRDNDPDGPYVLPRILTLQGQKHIYFTVLYIELFLFTTRLTVIERAMGLAA